MASKCRHHLDQLSAQSDEVAACRTDPGQRRFDHRPHQICPTGPCSCKPDVRGTVSASRRTDEMMNRRRKPQPLGASSSRSARRADANGDAAVAAVDLSTDGASALETPLSSKHLSSDVGSQRRSTALDQPMDRAVRFSTCPCPHDAPQSRYSSGSGSQTATTLGVERKFP